MASPVSLGLNLSCNSNCTRCCPRTLSVRVCCDEIGVDSGEEIEEKTPKTQEKTLEVAHKHLNERSRCCVIC